MDREDLELFERSLRHATESHTGAALDAALDALGWQDARGMDTRAAVSLLFDLQGRANATSSALGALVLDALGPHGSAGVPDPDGAPGAPGASGTDGPAGSATGGGTTRGDARAGLGVVLPALGGHRAPGRLEGDRVTVHGLGSATLAGAERALVVTTAGSGTPAGGMSPVAGGMASGSGGGTSAVGGAPGDGGTSPGGGTSAAGGAPGAHGGASPAGNSAAGTAAAGMSAVGMSAVGMSAVGMSAVGMSAVGMSAVGMSAVGRSAGEGAVAVTVATADLDVRVVGGIDPDGGLVEVSGEGRAEVVGPVDWPAAVRRGQVAVAHELVGASRRMLEMARQHALERTQFGVPIASFQAVRHRLAEALVAIEMAEAALDAAWVDGAPHHVVIAKSLAGQGARTTARHAQQVLAGIGYTLEHPFHRYFRRVLVLDELFGPSRTLAKELGTDVLRTRRLPPVLAL